VPGKFVDDPHRGAVIQISAAEQLLCIQRLAFEVGLEVLPQGVEMRRSHGRVIVPPNCIFSGFVANGEFVFRRSAGVFAGFDQQRAAIGDLCFAASNGLFV